MVSRFSAFHTDPHYCMTKFWKQSKIAPPKTKIAPLQDRTKNSLSIQGDVHGDLCIIPVSIFKPRSWAKFLKSPVKFTDIPQKSTEMILVVIKMSIRRQNTILRQAEYRGLKRAMQEMTVDSCLAAPHQFLEVWEYGGISSIPPGTSRWLLGSGLGLWRNMAAPRQIESHLPSLPGPHGGRQMTSLWERGTKASTYPILTI